MQKHQAEKKKEKKRKKNVYIFHPKYPGSKYKQRLNNNKNSGAMCQKGVGQKKRINHIHVYE